MRPWWRTKENDRRHVLKYCIWLHGFSSRTQGMIQKPWLRKVMQFYVNVDCDSRGASPLYNDKDKLKASIGLIKQNYSLILSLPRRNIGSDHNPDRTFGLLHCDAVAPLQLCMPYPRRTSVTLIQNATNYFVSL